MEVPPWPDRGLPVARRGQPVSVLEMWSGGGCGGGGVAAVDDDGMLFRFFAPNQLSSTRSQASLPYRPQQERPEVNHSLSPPPPSGHQHQPTSPPSTSAGAALGHKQTPTAVDPPR